MLTKTDLENIRQLIKEEVDFKIDALKEDIVLFKDEILHEIVNLRDDVTVLTGYRDMIEDHEIRIVKLRKNDATQLNIIA